MSHRSSLSGSGDDVMGRLPQEDVVRDPLMQSSDLKLPIIMYPHPPHTSCLHLWVKAPLSSTDTEPTSTSNPLILTLL